MENTRKPWQEELAELLDRVPPDQRPVARAFLVGYLNALEAEVKHHEENHA